MRHRQNYIDYLWIRPTGNWSPALLDLDLALILVFPPLPRPDILTFQVCYDLEVEIEIKYHKAFTTTSF